MAERRSRRRASRRDTPTTVTVAARSVVRSSVRAATMRSLSSTAEQPLHRALGLTDGELDRIVALLEREPNHFELAVFSLLWSEHCGYKHSALLLEAASEHGPRVPAGAGRERGRARPRRRARRRVQGREPQPPVGGRAVPGRGDRGRRHPARHLGHGRPAGGAARRSALRRARRCTSRARSAGSAHYGNCGGRPHRRRRGGLRRGVRLELSRQRDVRRAAARRSG